GYRYSLMLPGREDVSGACPVVAPAPWHSGSVGSGRLSAPEDPASRALVLLVLRGFPALFELREDLCQRHRVGQDVEQAAACERRRDDVLVEVGCDVDAAMRDAVVVRLG